MSEKPEKSFIKSGQIRATSGHLEDLTRNTSVEASEAILNAPKDQKLEKPLAAQPSRKWPKKSLIRGRKNALAVIGLKLDKADPAYDKCIKLADDYRKHRSRELVVVHGFVSAGVSSLLSTAALALAASRYLYERAGTDGEISLLITASKLADSARQSELAAWELCAREGVARKKSAAAQEKAPWLITKEGPGRPQKMRKHELERFIETSSPVLDGPEASDAKESSDSGEPSSDSESYSSSSTCPATSRSPRSPEQSS